jgi:hypothetical protein
MSNPIVKFESHKSHIVYKTKDGKRVPGASTVAKLGESAEGLIAWAWKLGTEGIDYKSVRDSAANSGTLAHWLIQCHFGGLEPDLSEFPKAVVSKAETAFIHFLSFWEGEKLAWGVSEVPYVSEQHGFGGTLDMVCTDEEGHSILLDFKTSDRIYQSHLSQLSAYEILWNEHHTTLPIWKRAIVRIPKADDGAFEVRWMANVEQYWALFKAQLALYNVQKRCKIEE